MVAAPRLPTRSTDRRRLRSVQQPKTGLRREPWEDVRGRALEIRRRQEGRRNWIYHGSCVGSACAGRGEMQPMLEVLSGDAPRISNGRQQAPFELVDEWPERRKCLRPIPEVAEREA